MAYGLDEDRYLISNYPNFKKKKMAQALTEYGDSTIFIVPEAHDVYGERLRGYFALATTTKQYRHDFFDWLKTSKYDKYI